MALSISKKRKILIGIPTGLSLSYLIPDPVELITKITTTSSLNTYFGFNFSSIVQFDNSCENKDDFILKTVGTILKNSYLNFCN